MPDRDSWLQIPSSLLDAGSKLSDAEDWAKQQKQKIADTWANAQKAAINAMQNQWQSQAAQVSGPAMTADDLQKLHSDTNVNPLPSKTFPTQQTSSFNPADVLSGTPPSAFENAPHLQPGTPENSFSESMREGASRAGIYIPPPPGSVVDPNKEITLQTQAEQNRTRPLLGPGGIGLYNPNLNPEGFKQAVNPGEPGEVVGKTVGEVPAVGGLLKFAVGAEGEGGGASKPISQAVSPELAASKQAAQEPVKTPILGGIFYSNAEKILQEKAPVKATGQQFLNTLINNGAKPVELAWTGIKDFLGGKADQPLLRTDVQKFIQDNIVQVQEVVKGEVGKDYNQLARQRDIAENNFTDAVSRAGLSAEEGNRIFNGLFYGERSGPQEVVDAAQTFRDAQNTLDAHIDTTVGEGPRYEGTVLPGGSNYRELLLTLPPKPPEPITSLPEGYAVTTIPATDTAYARYQVFSPHGVAVGPSSITREKAISNAVQDINNSALPETFRSSHWNEPNILAHVRFDERTDPQGKPMLFLQEVQSDWAQQGRKRGFSPEENAQKASDIRAQLDALRSISNERTLTPDEMKSRAALTSLRDEISSGHVLAMPFAKTEDWVKLAAKRMISWAADNGYERIGWTTGAQQDKIEGLGQRFTSLAYTPATSSLEGMSREGDRISYKVSPEGLGDYLGQDTASRLLASPMQASKSNAPYHFLTGKELQQPTKGMAEFYDKILPSIFKDLGKQFGATVEDVRTFTGEPPASIEERDGRAIVRWKDSESGGYHTRSFDSVASAQKYIGDTFKQSQEVIHSITIPPKMAQTAKAGQALFTPPSVGGAVAGGVYGAQQPADTPEQKEQNIAKYALGGGLLGRGLEAAGRGESLPLGLSIKPVLKDPATSPNLARAIEMFHTPPAEADYLSSQKFLTRVTRAYTHAWTDNLVDLVRIEQSIAKSVGRPLNDNEMLVENMRLNPSQAALLNLRKNFAPAIQQVGEADKTFLDTYLAMRHNIEVATQAGAKEEQKVLVQPLKNLPAQDQVRALNSRLTMYKRFLQQGIANSDGTVINHYQPLVAKTQKLADNAQKRLAAQIASGKITQAQAAAAAGQTIAKARAFSGEFDLDSSIQALDELEQNVGPQRFQNIQDAARQVTSFGDQLLQRRVDAGIITQATADDLRAKYPQYVPIRILDHMIEPIATGEGGSKLGSGNTGIKPLTQEGTAKLQETPLASMVRLAFTTEAAALKNETFNALHNLVQTDPTGQAQAIFKKVKPDTAPSRTTEIVHGLVDGAPTAYEMPKDVAASIRNLPMTQLPVLQQAMTIIRGIEASASPLFIPVHAAITYLPYMMRTVTREGTPLAIPRVQGALVAAYIDAFKHIGAGRYGPDTERYIAGGGAMFGSIFDYSPKAATASLEELSRANVFQIKNLGDVRRLALATLKGEPFANIINRVDLAPRVAAMKLAEARGAATGGVRAVTEGRTASIDFAVGGQYAKALNQFVPFFNVAMQGSAVIARAYKDNPRAFLETAITLLTAPTVGLEAWNRSDPQRNADYNDVPNYFKDTGLVFMAPTSAIVDAKGNRKPNFVYFPTREFSPFVILTREIAGRVMGGHNIAGMQMGEAHARSWQSLLYGENLATPSGGLLGSMSPVADVTRMIPGGPLGNMGIAVLTGKNPTTGGDIVTQSANQRSGALAHGIADTINAAKIATGSTGGIQSSAAQYVLNELGAPGRLAGAIGRPEGGTSLVPLYKNSTGQNLETARSEKLSPALVNFLNDAELPEVTPAARVVSGMTLTQQEEAELQNDLNAAFEQVSQEVMKDPRYQEADQRTRSTYAQKVLGNVRSAIGQKFIRTLESRYGSDILRQRMEKEIATPKAR